jgi:hypothetical protein
MQYQMFSRDANQAEILLNHQGAYLSREREQQPKSFDDVESLIKKHEDFVTTMSANEDKIQGVCSFAQRLCQENHYLGLSFLFINIIVRFRKGVLDLFGRVDA